MADNEQELHSWLEDYFLNISPDRKCDTIAIDIIATLKAMGYKSPEEQKPFDGRLPAWSTEKVDKLVKKVRKQEEDKYKGYVKFDREKVEDYLCKTFGKYYDGAVRKNFYDFADQLKEILTGGI